MNINAPPKSLQTLSRNIKFERNRLGLSQRKLAEDLGLKGSSTVTHWEKGNNYPTLELFVVLCAFFGRTADELLEMDLTTLPPPKLQTGPGEGETNKEGGRGQPARSQLPEEDKPPKEDKEDLKEVRRQLLQLMNKVEELEHN